MLKSTILFSFFVSLGCTPKMDAMLRHPLHVGVVDQPNVITHQNGWKSSIARLDDEAICFSVTYSVSSLNERPDPSFASRTLLMKAERTWYEDGEVVEEYEPTFKAHRFTRMMRQQTGTSMQCTRRNPETHQCEQSENRPAYRSVAVPTIRYEAEGGGYICFANQGRITQDSSRVVFSVDGVNFRWGLLGGRGLRRLGPRTAGEEGEEVGGER